MPLVLFTTNIAYYTQIYAKDKPSNKTDDFWLTHTPAIPKWQYTYQNFP